METDSIKRRDLLKGIGTAAIGGAAMSGSASAAIGVGYTVWSTEWLYVREGPGTGYANKAIADTNTGGYILDGPVNSDGYTWWKVRWNGDTDNGPVTGWSASDNNWIVGADFAYPASGTVTSTFYDYRAEGSSTHSGVDIANDYGTPLYAARPGYAYVVYQPDLCGHGVKIYHDNGWATLYCHMSNVGIYDGQRVGWFDYIGDMGQSGYAFEPHVHFEIHYNSSGDEAWLPPEENREGSWIYANSGVPKNFF